MLYPSEYSHVRNIELLSLLFIQPLYMARNMGLRTNGRLIQHVSVKATTGGKGNFKSGRKKGKIMKIK